MSISPTLFFFAEKRLREFKGWPSPTPLRKNPSTKCSMGFTWRLVLYLKLPGGRQPHFPPLCIPCRSADQQRTAEIKPFLTSILFKHLITGTLRKQNVEYHEIKSLGHTCVPSFPIVWSYLEMSRLGEPTLFPFEESLRKERLWLNGSWLIRKCHVLKCANISSSFLLKSNGRVNWT